MTTHQAQVDAAREECAGLIAGLSPYDRADALDAIDRLAALASAPLAPPTSEHPSISLTAREILVASQWAANGGTDDDQLDSEWTIGWTDGTPNVDHDLEVKPGYVMWLSDYPEEGCLPLDTEDEPTVTPPAPAASEPVATRTLIEECRDALAEELAGWDIDPPLHHVKQAHDRCVDWLTVPQPPAASSDALDARRMLRTIINRWYEFGPEHGFGELICQTDAAIKGEQP